MRDISEAADGLLGRAELEIELAHFALKLARSTRNLMAAGEIAIWIHDEATALISQTQPDLRPFAGERLRQIAESLTGADVSVVEAAYGLVRMSEHTLASDGLG